MTTSLPSLTGTVVAGWTVGIKTSPKNYAVTCPNGHKRAHLAANIRKGTLPPCKVCIYAADPTKKPKKGSPLPAVGTKFSKWTVTGSVFAANAHGNKHWLVLARCECGTNAKIRPTELSRGRTKGCRSCLSEYHKASRPEPKPARPAKLAVAVAPKPKPVKLLPMVDVPHPTVWNAKTIEDLLLRRAARVQLTE